jgi:hypothetical protein
MKQPSQTGPAKDKNVILYLGANPDGTDRLALDREKRAIREVLRRSKARDRFKFVTRSAVEPLHVLRHVRELRPTVVHFSGHGAARKDFVAEATHRRDIVLESEVGGPQFVSPEAIAKALGAAGSSVKLVVLSACFTESMASALLAHVDCVVGMSGSIRDDAARSFAVGFYGGLWGHQSIAAAFKQGQAAIALQGSLDDKVPQLEVRDGFDPTQFILTALKSEEAESAKRVAVTSKLFREWDSRLGPSRLWLMRRNPNWIIDCESRVPLKFNAKKPTCDDAESAYHGNLLLNFMEDVALVEEFLDVSLSIDLLVSLDLWYDRTAPIRKAVTGKIRVQFLI